MKTLLFDNSDQVIKLQNSDAIALYFFYCYHTSIQKTNSIYCTNTFAEKGLSLNLRRIQKAKKILIANGLVSEKIIRNEKGLIIHHYIVINDHLSKFAQVDGINNTNENHTDAIINDNSGLNIHLCKNPLGGDIHQVDNYHQMLNTNTINTKENTNIRKEEKKEKEKKEEAGGESPSQGIGLNADANTFFSSSSKKPLIPKEEAPLGASKDNTITNSIDVSSSAIESFKEDRVNHCPTEDNSIATFRIEFKKYLSINLLVYGKAMKNEIYDKIIEIEEKHLLSKYPKIKYDSFINHIDKNWKYYQTYYLYLFVTGAEKKDGDYQITKSLLIEKTEVAYTYFSLNRDKTINDLFDSDNFNNWKKSFELDVELKLSVKMKKAFPKLTTKEKQKLLDLKKALDSEMIKLDDYLEFYVEKGGELIANFFMADGFLQRFYNYVNDDEQMRYTIQCRKSEIQKLNLKFIASKMGYTGDLFLRNLIDFAKKSNITTFNNFFELCSISGVPFIPINDQYLNDIDKHLKATEREIIRNGRIIDLPLKFETEIIESDSVAHYNNIKTLIIAEINRLLNSRLITQEQALFLAENPKKRLAMRGGESAKSYCDLVGHLYFSV